MTRRLVAALILFAIAAGAQAPQGAVRVKAGLDRLSVLGSVLMIAAHPDDENTALLAYCARGRQYRTAYLSLTRGEGGQNLIGSEQGDLMGVIRTQELLAARRVDGAEQYFTRAIDFGFSKTAEETLIKWGREKVLADIVFTIRKFQPDVIVLRFSGTPRDGHGQHQSSAILGKEAFTAAADPKRFPEQLSHVQTWQAKRLLWNAFNFTRAMEKEAAVMPGRIEIDTGEYNPLLGFSYGEIAGISRSLHRSQGMGAAERKGPMKNYLTLVAGEAAQTDLMDGVDTSWQRVPGGEQVEAMLAEARRRFELERPQSALSSLNMARTLMAKMRHPWAAAKLREADELIAQAAGLWLDANALRYSVSPGREIKVSLTAMNRSGAPVSLAAMEVEGFHRMHAVTIPESPLHNNQPLTKEISIPVPEDWPLTQPYWLNRPHGGTLYTVDDYQLLGAPEAPAVLQAHFRLRVQGADLELTRPVTHRWVDPVRGELNRGLVVAPPVAVEFSERSVLFAGKAPRKVELQVRAVNDPVKGEAVLQAPEGWKVSPASLPFQLAEDGEMAALSFSVSPPEKASKAVLRAEVRAGTAVIHSGVHLIQYDHISPQTLFPTAQASLVRADVETLARNVGYVMGAGDEVPAALRQLGVRVNLLTADELARGDLSGYDAIVAGIRAYNTRKDLRANQERLMDYVAKGGTFVVQYNVLEGGFTGGNPNLLDRIGPYPMKISRDRITVEEAPMHAVRADHPLLQAPNRISSSDFEGWVQERGLYFASEWDSKYQPVWRSNDPGEKPLEGGTLYARYGKGVYIFTALSWFRQLPAGVPGAYRIFANLLSAGKLVQ